MARLHLFPASARQAVGQADPTLPLLEFELPTAGLMATRVKPAARSMLWTVVSLVALCATAMAVVPIDMVVTTADGRVVGQDPTVVVQPLETAIVRSIDVREGQVVHAGQVMARLDPTFSSADVDALKVQVRSYQAEVDRLSAEASDRPYSPSTTDPATTVQEAVYSQRHAEYRAQVESYTQRIDSLKEQVIRAQDDMKAFAQRRQIAALIEAKRRELEKLQVGSVMNRLSAEDQRVEIERDLSDAVGTAERASREMQQLTAERTGYEQQWKAQVNQDLHDRSRSLSDAKENLRKAELRHRLVELRAEQDAIVLTVGKVSVGSVMQSGEQFFTLVPTASPMEIEGRIAGDDAGYVHVGQKVTIKFDTFPYVRYGTAEGTVRTLSADSFVGQEESARPTVPAPSSQVPPYYKTRVAIDAVKMHGVPGGFQLKPGMPVTADIEVGKRNMLRYLFARLLPVGLEGMREP